MISTEDAEEWTQSLAQVGAGWWRQVALAVRQGVPASLGMSLDAWREDRLGGLVLKSIPERQAAVAELAEDGFTQRQIARVLGVALGTVNSDLNPKPPVQNRTEDADSSSDDGLAGVQNRTGELEDAPLWPDEPHDLDSGFASAAATGEPLREAFERLAAGEEPEHAPKPTAQINEGDEWYTPRWLFDALGIKFAIDVCAPLDQTHSSVPAEQRFTIEDDGLAQPWHGTVWCNPPYSKPEPWARRMIHHGDGLLLTHMPMNAGWCVDTWEACDAIRLFQAMEFVRPDGSVQRPGYWLQLTAFGPTATEALARLQPLGEAAANKRRVASPMWRPVA